MEEVSGGMRRSRWGRASSCACPAIGSNPLTAGRTVYLVEDDAGMRDALSLLLRGAGFDVRSYPSAEIFLSEVDCSKSICLLTDVRLPGMDGIALFRHLVQLGTEPAVVVITGHGDIPMAVAALKDGVVDFVEKPFDPGMLLDSVREASQRAAANAERRPSRRTSKRGGRH